MAAANDAAQELPAPPTIAIIRYSMPHVGVERAGADEAAEMGVEPSGQRSQARPR